MSDLDGNLGYFAKQQCSTQWHAFLNAFAVELGQQVPVNELRVLMGRFGKLMAQSLPTPAGNTIAELEKSINSIWFDMNWGWANLVEREDGLFIAHHAAPLQSAFGEDALAWSPAILEAIYAHWFSAISGSSALQLTQAEPAQANSLLMVFRFGRPA
ncbi:MAG TPA: cellulose biosynthesis protein BcsD [Gallionella sp.]|nr:cellulose biosynthesis protein BcsD [Gallionella sp.]